MGRVIVGVDPHNKSVTIEAVDEGGTVLARGRFGTDAAGYRLLVKHVREQWPHHQWAIEGAQGVGRPLAQQLLAQGETVLDVPAKLAVPSSRWTRQRPRQEPRSAGRPRRIDLPNALRTEGGWGTWKRTMRRMPPSTVASALEQGC